MSDDARTDAATSDPANPLAGRTPSELFSHLCAYGDDVQIDGSLSVGEVRRAVREYIAARDAKATSEGAAGEAAGGEVPELLVDEVLRWTDRSGAVHAVTADGKLHSWNPVWGWWGWHASTLEEARRRLAERLAAGERERRREVESAFREGYASTGRCTVCDEIETAWEFSRARAALEGGAK